jgi:predicted transcriptional regulator
MDISTNDSMFLEVIKSLSNPIRVKILQYALTEITQHGLAEILNVSDSRISQNIDILEDVGLLSVSKREKGRKYVKSITNGITFQILPVTTTVRDSSE